MKKTIILIMCIISILFLVNSANAMVRVVISGKVYKDEVGVNELTVYAKNLRTEKIITNALIIPEDGSYKISLEKIEGGLKTGDNIKLYTSKIIDNITYYAEATFVLSEDIVMNGGIIRKDLILKQEYIPGVHITPGFELMVLAASLGIAAIILKRRKIK